jgi:hypothetical protein
MNERIIGVAVRHPDQGVYSLLAPARHGQILRLVSACYPDDPDAAHKVEQGFITDHCRFLTREEARELVRYDMGYMPVLDIDMRHYPRIRNHGTPEAPQPSHHPTQLFSEDLW